MGDEEDEGPGPGRGLTTGEGVGGTMVGVAGILGLRGDGDEEEKEMEAFERSAPKLSTSGPSLRSTVPPARRACSKSKSVRETRLAAWRSLDPTAWRPDGKEEGGAGDRGEGCRKRDARLAGRGRECVARVKRLKPRPRLPSLPLPPTRAIYKSSVHLAAISDVFFLVLQSRSFLQRSQSLNEGATRSMCAVE